MIVFLRDSNDNCVLLQWFSRKYARVAPSILPGETVVYVTVLDLAFAIHHCLKQILSRELPFYLFTDSSSLFSTVTKFQAVREKRLSIGLAVLRQAYQRREVTSFGFVRQSVTRLLF
jgi:hypothetical protein